MLKAGSLAVFLVLMSAIVPEQAGGYEVDNITARDALTRDALRSFDRKVNEILRRAVKDANKESRGDCSSAVLRQEIVRWTRPSLVSFLELWGILSDDVQRTSTALASSIYSGVTITESPGLWAVGIGRAFKLNGHVVGTDKIGHFFMQGLDYFRMVHDDRRSLEDVLAREHGEDGFYGLGGTGVKSYADMAANYDGFRFWTSLFGGARPYVRCGGRTGWVVARDFTWADYVSAAWDEGINCSEFSPRLAPRVAANLARMGLACPVVHDSCAQMAGLEKAKYYVNPSCLKAIAHSP